MANKKSTRKTVSKKQKSNKKNNRKNNKKLSLMIITIAIIIILVIVISISIVNSKRLTCTKIVSENGFKTDSKVILKLSNKKIKSIDLTRTISVIDSNTSVKYLPMIKSSLDDIYKQYDNYTITSDDKKITISLLYNENKKYIIDNIFIDKEDEGISFNVVKEDMNGNYATFDLSKIYTKNSVKKLLKKSNYICK